MNTCQDKCSDLWRAARSRPPKWDGRLYQRASPAKEQL